MRKFLWVMLALVGVGIVLWTIIPAPPPPPPPARLPETAWQLPAGQKPPPQKALELLRTAELWGKVPEPAAQTAPAEPRWRFVAVAIRGAERYVLIEIQGQPQQQLKIGDTVPGGSKILDIEGATLCLLVNGQKRKLDIFPQERQI